MWQIIVDCNLDVMPLLSGLSLPNMWDPICSAGGQFDHTEASIRSADYVLFPVMMLNQ